LCLLIVPVQYIGPCPGQTYTYADAFKQSGDTVFLNPFSPTLDIKFDHTVPAATIEIFSSGTLSSRNTIAGAFDIQPRSLQLQSDSRILHGRVVPASVNKDIQLLMLNNRTQAIEGLIVDTRIGKAAVGFRNHTLPTSPLGGRWREV